jgi:hypothetical protein
MFKVLELDIVIKQSLDSNDPAEYFIKSVLSVFN